MSVVLICIFLVTGKTEYPFLCFLDWCVSPSVHCLANPLPILKIEFPVFFLLIYSSGMFEVWLCSWLCTDFSQTIISLLTLFLGHSMELKSLDGQIPWFFFFFLAFIILKILFKSSCPSQAYKAFLLLFFPSDSFYPWACHQISGTQSLSSVSSLASWTFPISVPWAFTSFL